MVTPSSKGRWLLYRTEGTVLAITQPPAFTQNSPSPGAVPLAWPVAARSQVLPFPSRSDLSVSLLASPAPYSNTARREALGSTKHPQPGQLKNPFVCLVEPLGCHPAQAGLAVPWRGSCVRSYPGHAGSSAHTAATLFLFRLSSIRFLVLSGQRPQVWSLRVTGGLDREGTLAARPHRPVPAAVEEAAGPPSCAMSQPPLLGAAAGTLRRPRRRSATGKSVLNSHTDAGLVCCLEGSATSSCDPKKAKHSGGVEGAAPCSAG